MDIPVVILAGGLGTRLSQISGDKPKALVDINGVPFIDLKIEELVEGGATSIYLLVGYKGDALFRHVSQAKYDVPISIISDGSKVRGTAGALWNALPLINAEKFVVTYGDNLLKIKVSDVYSAAIKDSLLVTTTILGPADKYNCKVSDGKVVQYSKNYSNSFSHVDYGYLVLTKESFLQAKGNENADLEPVLQNLSNSNKLNALVTDDAYIEIGTPESLYRAQNAI